MNAKSVGTCKIKVPPVVEEFGKLLLGPVSQNDLGTIGALLEALDHVLDQLTEFPDFIEGYHLLQERLQNLIFEQTNFEEDLAGARKMAAHLATFMDHYLETGEPPNMAQMLQPEPAPVEKALAFMSEYEQGTEVIQKLSADLADESLAAEFISETEDALDSAESLLMILEKEPAKINTLIHPIFRTMHSLKGNAAAFDLETMKSLAHHMEDLLVKIRDGEKEFSPEYFVICFKGIDTLRRLLLQLKQLMEGEQVLPVDVGEVHQLISAAGMDRPATPQAPMAAPKPMAEGPVPAKSDNLSPPGKPTDQPAGRKRKIDEMIKVPARKLDELGELIGEMVVALSVLNQSPVIEAMVDRQARERLDQLEKVTESLRERILGIRMFPVGNVFAKLSRQIRDLASSCDKQLRLEVEGSDTLVDKSIIDALYAPLMHLVRNAIDHGIESPQERLAAGKAGVGRVRLTATHCGDSILLEIEDDGKGIDTAAVLRKAISRNLARPGDELTERQIFNLLFQPGFTTAQTVTELSGRGVGLDVVKKAFENLRGRISIHSKPGLGTTFSIKLPLTTSIIEGLVVRIGTSLFVIPILDVQVTITPKAEQLKDVHGQCGQFFLYAGVVTPIIKLYEVFKIEPEIRDPSKGLLIIVAEGNQKFGLMVDELLYRQQVVIKKLSRRFCTLEGVSGGTILGNGRVGLILEPQTLIHLER